MSKEITPEFSPVQAVPVREGARTKAIIAPERGRIHGLSSPVGMIALATLAGEAIFVIPDVYNRNDDLASEAQVVLSVTKEENLEVKRILIGGAHIEEEVTDGRNPDMQVHTVKIDFDRDGTWDSVHSTCHGDYCISPNDTQDLNGWGDEAAKKWIGHHPLSH